MTRLLGATLTTTAFALAAAIVPMPRDWIERWYSSGAYPRIQALVTPITNLVPVALLDITAVVLALSLLILFVRRIRASGFAQGALRGMLGIVLVASILYILFLVLWGLNYRRVPLEQKLAFDSSRISPYAALAFAGRMATSINDGYAEAHRTSFDPRSLAAAFARAEHALGVTRDTVPGLPKRSALTLYFRRAAVDGMTDPFFLEIILNPDVLPVERPIVQAHEWAHLAGFADESEANFVAFVTCVQGDPLARYSAWLAAYQHVAAALPRQSLQDIPRLAEGPRADLRAMTQRYYRSSLPVRRAARAVYDRYLKANRVPEGIASYDAVVRLLLGSSFDESGMPHLR
jgi:hypothetical protein